MSNRKGMEKNRNIFILRWKRKKIVKFEIHFGEFENCFSNRFFPHSFILYLHLFLYNSKFVLKMETNRMHVWKMSCFFYCFCFESVKMVYTALWISAVTRTKANRTKKSNKPLTYLCYTWINLSDFRQKSNISALGYNQTNGTNKNLIELYNEHKP